MKLRKLIIFLFVFSVASRLRATNDVYEMMLNGMKTEAAMMARIERVPQRSLKPFEIEVLSRDENQGHLGFNCIPSEREHVFGVLSRLAVRNPDDGAASPDGVQFWSRSGVLTELACFASEPRTLDLLRACSKEEGMVSYYATMYLGLSAHLQQRDEEVVDDMAFSLDHVPRTDCYKYTALCVAGLRSERAVEVLIVRIRPLLDQLAGQPGILFIRGSPNHFHLPAEVCAAYLAALASMSEESAHAAVPELFARLSAIYAKDPDWERLLTSYPQLALLRNQMNDRMSLNGNEATATPSISGNPPAKPAPAVVASESVWNDLWVAALFMGAAALLGLQFLRFRRDTKGAKA